MKRLLLVLLLGGCALPVRDRQGVPQQNVDLRPASGLVKEDAVIVACPDDGVHTIVNGVCSEPCPSDDHHHLVNGVCVDILGK